MRAVSCWQNCIKYKEQVWARAMCNRNAGVGWTYRGVEKSNKWMVALLHSRRMNTTNGRKLSKLVICDWFYVTIDLSCGGEFTCLVVQQVTARITALPLNQHCDRFLCLTIRMHIYHLYRWVTAWVMRATQLISSQCIVFAYSGSKYHIFSQISLPFVLFPFSGALYPTPFKLCKTYFSHHFAHWGDIFDASN